MNELNSCENIAKDNKEIDKKTSISVRCAEIIKNNTVASKKNNNVLRNKKVTSIYTNRTQILREKLGLTQQEFADELNVTLDFIKKLEKDEGNENRDPLTLDMALRVSEKYSVGLDWLFGITDDDRDEMLDIVTCLGKVLRVIRTGNKLYLFIDGDFYDYLKDIQDLQDLSLNMQNIMNKEDIFRIRDGIQKKYRKKNTK